MSSLLLLSCSSDVPQNTVFHNQKNTIISEIGIISILLVLLEKEGFYSFGEMNKV